ncbi:ribosomal lysine N-methyltransferase [Aspergillus melleus]|uniref:ribosomal lysine N-methyltransferase n=1 Tax=Aspergillus melleus TaxID=138277 RepID=UPI001E8CC870|nr:Ribosomal lysine N-methyltransferase 4 [Aspergillus melleus]KAH8431302.1 Ribosomal lysine N-methyltransferase 4 [Aspergillus melleus]
MSSTAHFPDPDHFQHQSDEFLHWLAGKPGVQINPKIRIADLRSQAAGRGVVAQADIAEGEELFTIPRDLILSTRNSQLKDRLSKNLEELGPWLSLMLVMIYEFLLGEQSAWAPYFKVLPRKFDTLMFWSAPELQELQGSSIIEKIGKEGAEKSILQTIAPIVRANPNLFPPIEGLASYDGDAGTEVLLNLAHVMGSLIMAYAFDIEKPEDEEENDDGEDGYLTDEEEMLPKGMVPLADLLNANADQNNARLFQDENTFTMKAIKPITPGAEVFNDYGEIPRADLLRRYGYVTDNYAPYDVVELPLEIICEAASLENADAEEQPPLELLEYLELLDDGYVIPRISPHSLIENIVTDELSLLLRTLTLPVEQLEQYRSKQKAPKPAFGPTEGAIFMKAIQLKQAQYGTTIAQDQELLAQLAHSGAPGLSEETARRYRMAIQVRLGEKEILQNLATLIHNHLANSSQNGQKRAANGDDDESRASKFLRS